VKRFWIVVGLAIAVLLAGAATVWARGHTRPAHRNPKSHRKPNRHRRHQARHGARATHHKRRRPGRHRHGTRGTTKVATAPAPTTSTTTTGGTGATAAGPCPSGPPGSAQSVGSHTYALEGIDTFTKSAPLGSFAQSRANQVVYVGDHGMAWTGYADGWSSTYTGGAEGYQPSTVQSVHDGVLDFYLHNDSNGNPVGADPSPLPGGNRYQTYGVWSFCERVANSLADFHQAPMLWPQNDGDAPSAESDYPEATLNHLDFSGYTHYGGSGSQDAFNIQSLQRSFNPSQWHVYTQSWGPGFRSYFVDGTLVGTSTNQLWSSPERFQLQIEPSGTNDGGTGHVYVKWVWIGTPRS
jgi:Glycosyl hydrolases family 16